jgi:hypothetical protein
VIPARPNDLMRNGKPFTAGELYQRTLSDVLTMIAGPPAEDVNGNYHALRARLQATSPPTPQEMLDRMLRSLP